MIHHLGDLARMHDAQRAAGHREILGINADRFAGNGAGAGDHTVSVQFLVVHSEVFALVFDEQVVLMKRTRVKQCRDAFAGRHFSAGALLAHGLVTTTFGDRRFASEKIKDSLRK